MSDTDKTLSHEVLEGMEFSIRLERFAEDGEAEQLDLSVSHIRRDENGRLVGQAIAVDEFALDCESDQVEVPENIVLVEGSPAVADAHDEDQPHRPFISKKLAAAIGGATVAAGTAIVVTYFARRKKS